MNDAAACLITVGQYSRQRGSPGGIGREAHGSGAGSGRRCSKICCGHKEPAKLNVVNSVFPPEATGFCQPPKGGGAALPFTRKPFDLPNFGQLMTACKSASSW